MGYTLDLGAWSAVFAVPAALVDRFLRDADAGALKVMLYLLRHAGRTFSEAELAEAAGLSAADVSRAVSFWREKGLLREAGGALSPRLVPAAPEETPPADAAKPAAPAPAARLLRPDGVYVSEYIERDPEVRALLGEVENLLGKTLSPALSGTLVQAREDLGLPCDVILMLVQYALRQGRANAGYIASTAKGWAEAGIFDIPAAETRLRELDETAAAWRRCEAAFGMPSRRAPSRYEGECARRWVSEWHMPDELLKEAYDRSVDRTGKVTMKYINAVLERWHNAGIHTLAEAAAQDAARKPADSRAPTFDLAAYQAYDFFAEDDD